MTTTIAFDIEVAGFPWEEVDEITRGYLVNREHDPAKRDAIPERTGLYPGLGKIIAIGAPSEVMANPRVQEAYLGT